MRPPLDKKDTFDADLHDLRAFCLVVDLGSITAAAKVVGETKGSVSRRLTRLERALGVELLRRSPRLVQATEEGLAYRARVGQALDLLEDANASIQRAGATPSGHLRVTAPVDLGLRVLAPLMAGFLERYPEISLEMLLTEAVLDFDAHQLDLALRASASLSDSSLIAYKLRRVEIGMFASPAWLREHPPLKTPDDLRDRPILSNRAVRGHTTLALQRKDGRGSARVEARVAISASDFSFLREAALAGAGIALLPDILIQEDVEAGRLAPVLDDYVTEGSGHLHLVHAGTRALPPKIRALRDYLLDAFGVKKRRDPG